MRYPRLVHLLILLMITISAHHATADTLFTNVNVFDGQSDQLLTRQNVLVMSNRIAKISARPIDAPSAAIISGEDMTLMPGLIDVHTHLAFNDRTTKIEADFTLDYMGIRTAKVAERTLMEGFTSVRDLGGPVFGTQRAIDEGLIVGPRIFASGAFLSQTSGHGDFRARNDRNPTLTGNRDSNFERLGVSIIADGTTNVLAATRQNLMQGATQIKIMAGGGGASSYDPIDTTQYTEEEMRAAVSAAADWGTYVTAHLFNPKSAKRAIRAGIQCLDHALFIDEATIRMAVKADVFVAPQFWALSPELFKHPDLKVEKHEAIRAMHALAKDFVPLLIKHKAKVPFATDLLGDPDEGAKSRHYEIAWRAELFGSNFEVLRQMTSVGGELLARSGPRNPAVGSLGVIEPGAMADILLVEGNPLEDLSVIGANPKWFDAPKPGPIDSIRLIMKDGVIYKNTL
ncbi:MAG TPA: amidohydrolase family protein [Gammaproteobacteria bacterium]|nr:amidohydrolase family protein [Gammaproteobacteria bacterium]